MNDILQITVVLINYKTPQLCIDCLTTLIPELEPFAAKVAVVDNASGDDSVTQIQAWIDHHQVGDIVMLMASKENTGFSGGNNLGIQSIDSDYYLLLNSDTLVRPGAIQTLLEAAEKHSSAGLVSPRLEWPDATPQESCFKFHTPISELIHSSATGIITRFFRKYVVAQPVQNEPASYDWTSFACVLIRKAVFDDLGLMDDGYFMYFEDVEFCHRAKQAGWKVLNVPDAHVVHLRGGSSSVKKQTQLRKRLPRYYYESRTRFFYQVYGKTGLLLANILWSLGFGIASLRSLLTPNFVPSVSACQWRDIWINFFDPLKPYMHPDDYDKT